MHLDIRKALTNNWPIKLTALLLATVLWAAVATSEPSEIVVPVAVQVEPPEGRALTRSLPSVQAVYRGSVRELIRLFDSPPTIRKFIPDTLSANEYTVQLSLQDLTLTAALDVSPLDIRPRSIQVVLDDKAARTLPIVPRVTVATDSGYRLFGSIEVRPESVAVVGPRDLVQRLERVYTQPLDLTGVRSQFNRTIRLDTSNMGVARLSRREVEVSARVERIAERVIMGVPVSLRSDRGGNWTSTPPAVLVTINGPGSLVPLITRDSITAVASFRGTRDSALVRVNLVVPPNITATASPPQVMVHRRRNNGD